ncbi:MAG: hypothetical protein ABIH35_02950, partial [Patescibacteria group bacterium]
MPAQFRIINRTTITTFAVVAVFLVAYILQVQRGEPALPPTSGESFFVMDAGVQQEILRTFDFMIGFAKVADEFPERLKITDAGDGLTVAVQDGAGNVLTQIFEFQLPADATVEDILATLKSNLANFNLEILPTVFSEKAFAFLDADTLTTVL